MTDWNEMSADSNALRHLLARRWVKLTEEDLDRVAGDREALLGVLQERYSLSREQAEHSIVSFIDRAASNEDGVAPAVTAVS